MEITFFEYVVLFLSIGFAGFVDAIAGGGGLLTIPIYMSIGVPTHLILGTNKLVSTSGTSVAVWRYVRQKVIHWKLMAVAIIMGMGGAFFGARLSIYLSLEMMVVILIIIIPVIFLLQKKLDHKGKSSGNLQDNRSTMIKAGLLGSIIGMYDGLFGPGTGTFLIIGFVLFLHMNYRQASANGRIINYITNLSALVFFIGEGRIYWPVAGVALAGAMIGNYIGSGLVLTRAEKIVGPIFKLVLLALLGKCIFDIYQGRI